MSVMRQVLRWPLRLIPRDWPLRVVGGPLRGARWVPGAGVHSYWLGRYEPAEIAIFTSRLAAGETVFDVGAHVGYYTLIASRLVGPSGAVVAFEPNPRNLAYLRRHVTLNDCANVRVLAAAVADVAGRSRFQESTQDAEGLLSSTGAIDVDVVTLDAIAYGTPGLAPPSLLKIDVEGAEQRALLGAERLLSEARPDLLLSTHGRENYVGCQVTLARHGYQVRQMSTESKGTELLATVRGA